ncbi:MAG: FMN-binding protein [Lachnospiraceae bacterium]|nr:FMN-binding protein [Lachnospiraceae bacterium]
MKKKAILAALFFLICGCGCAPKTNSEATEASGQTSGKTEASSETEETKSSAESETFAEEAAGDVYTASGKGAVGKITVTLVVADGQVVDCVIDGSKETPDKGGVVAEKFQEAFLNGASVDELEAVSGASISSATIKQLLRKCLDEAGVVR